MDRILAKLKTGYPNLLISYAATEADGVEIQSLATDRAKLEDTRVSTLFRDIKRLILLTP